MDLDTLIANVKDKYATLIQKPKMNEKLLSKPPFRFLHDTISAVISTTGFGEGLYTAVEMDSSQIQEKQAKLDYLDKIFKLVGICKVSNAINLRYSLCLLCELGISFKCEICKSCKWS